jgi:hypothetical protein
MKVVLTGIGIGLLGALGVGQVLSRMVYGIAVRDPATFAGGVVALTIISLRASFRRGALQSASGISLLISAKPV